MVLEYCSSFLHCWYTELMIGYKTDVELSSCVDGSCSWQYLVFFWHQLFLICKVNVCIILQDWYSVSVFNLLLIPKSLLPDVVVISIHCQWRFLVIDTRKITLARIITHDNLFSAIDTCLSISILVQFKHTRCKIRHIGSCITFASQIHLKSHGINPTAADNVFQLTSFSLYSGNTSKSLSMKVTNWSIIYACKWDAVSNLPTCLFSMIYLHHAFRVSFCIHQTITCANWLIHYTNISTPVDIWSNQKYTYQIPLLHVLAIQLKWHWLIDHDSPDMAHFP